MVGESMDEDEHRFCWSRHDLPRKVNGEEGLRARVLESSGMDLRWKVGHLYVYGYGGHRFC